MTQTCYMCNEPAEGNEHVPPKCLFPEQKDLPTGIDLRKKLITVPACDKHNTSKSDDDEYLLYLLVMNVCANKTANNQFVTKIMRSIQRNQSLCERYFDIQEQVVVVDEKTGQAHNTVAVYIDDARLNLTLDHIARALYFHQFKTKWLGVVKTLPDFLLASLDPDKGRKQNAYGELMAAFADQHFEGVAFHGENPEVFKYQVLEGTQYVHKFMRLYFYDGCRVSVFFTGNG